MQHPVVGVAVAPFVNTSQIVRYSDRNQLSDQDGCMGTVNTETKKPHKISLLLITTNT